MELRDVCYEYRSQLQAIANGPDKANDVPRTFRREYEKTASAVDIARSRLLDEEAGQALDSWKKVTGQVLGLL